MFFTTRINQVTPGELKLLEEFQAQNPDHFRYEERKLKVSQEVVYRLFAANPLFLIQITQSLTAMRAARLKLEELYTSTSNPPPPEAS